MRIAVVANTVWYLFNFRLNLCLALQQDGHAVVTIAPAGDHAQLIEAAGVPFVPVAISGGGVNPWVEWQSVRQLARVLMTHQVDAVLSYTPKGNVYSALACLWHGVAFVPNVSGLGRVFVRQTPLTLLVRWLYRLTFRRAKRVFFQNHDDLQTFVSARLVLPGLAERLPGSGVDLTRFLPQCWPHDAHAAPVFLLVARMLWDKGVGEFVAAARAVRVKHPSTRFHLLGFLDVVNPSAVAREHVEQWVAEGVVQYFPPTDDVRPHLTAASCVVLPSFYREGVPRSLLEAAASARPIITTDTSGCRDTVQDGQTGFLCKPKDVEDLAAKMLTFLELTQAEREAMGQRARRHMEDNFGEHLVIDRYLAVVAEIAVGSPR
jgi:glycosyltransferase involved in cell wall biosynthesis